MCTFYKTVSRLFILLLFVFLFFSPNLSVSASGPIVRLIEHSLIERLTDEQLKIKYKEKIEQEKQKWEEERIQEELQKLEPHKNAYLTFDDGPNKHTAEILDILQKHEVQATFFMLEPKIWEYSEDVKRMVAEQHTIASHSVTHDKKKVYRSPQALLDEMNKTREALIAVTGQDSSLIRVPYGSKPYMKKEFRDILVENNLHMWDWNVDSNDWRYTPKEIVATVKYQVLQMKQKKQAPVILFHNHPETIKVLPELIEFLKAEGYVLNAYHSENHFMVNFWNDERL